MRSVVYNRYWTTLGGGEMLAASFAWALRQEGEVVLLSHQPVPVATVEDRLQVDLSGVSQRVVADAPEAVAAASAGADVFVNCSYQSRAPNRAARGLYVTYFPDHPPRVPRPWWAEASRGLGPPGARGRAGVEARAGFYPLEGDPTDAWRWSGGTGCLEVTVERTGPVPVRLVLDGRHRPAELDPVVEITAGSTVHRRLLRRDVPTPVHLEVEGDHRWPVPVVVRSDTFRPPPGSGDDRLLGVQLRGAEAGWPEADELIGLAGAGAETTSCLGHLDSYTDLVAISEFTRRWIARLWGRESTVLHPAAPPVGPGPKERVILSVGRFFARDAGHSKKQLELVGAFDRFEARGLRGWELHLVGGCSPEQEPFLRALRQAATSPAVHLHVDADRSVLVDLYRRASVYWHGTGLGEDAHRDPMRLEHFGISVLEAMSAGAVPLVVGEGGPAEVVEHGTSGLHFGSVDELVDQTELLAGDPELMARLGQGALDRADHFSPGRFRARLLALLAA